MIRRALRYRVFVRTAIQDALAFRAQFLGTLALSGLSLLLSYYLWHAVYGGADRLAGIRIHQMMTYLVSALVYGALVGGTIAYLGEAFVTGSLGTDLIRPLSFPVLCLARSVGSAAVYFILRGIPVFVLGAIFIGIRWPGPGAAAAFAASLVMAFLLYFILEFILAQLTLFTQTYHAVSQLWGLLVTFATGALIPLPFFPGWIRECLFVLPFHAIFYTPINIFMRGELEAGPFVALLTGRGFAPTLAVLTEQILWVVVLACVAAAAWKVSKPRLLVQGG